MGVIGFVMEALNLILKMEGRREIIFWEIN